MAKETQSAVGKFSKPNCPVYCGPNAREQALSYARQRAGYGRAEIQVLDESGNVAERIGNEEVRPLV